MRKAVGHPSVTTNDYQQSTSKSDQTGTSSVRTTHQFLFFLGQLRDAIVDQTHTGLEMLQSSRPMLQGNVPSLTKRSFAWWHARGQAHTLARSSFKGFPSSGLSADSLIMRDVKPSLSECQWIMMWGGNHASLHLDLAIETSGVAECRAGLAVPLGAWWCWVGSRTQTLPGRDRWGSLAVAW